MSVGLEDLLHRPGHIVVELETELALTDIEVMRSDDRHTLLEANFQPTLELDAHGFPSETARILQFNDPRHPLPYAFPIGPTRTWLHRYPLNPEGGCFEQLCLWYPWDPPRLQWNWPKGLADYLGIVRRHLWFEEHHRRSGSWPVEDMPHGQPVATKSDHGREEDRR